MNLLPLLTIDIEATARPAGSHPELIDSGDKHDSPLPFHLTEADISPSAPYVDAWTREARKGLAPRPNRGNDFSNIPGDSELRDLARVDAREFVK